MEPLMMRRTVLEAGILEVANCRLKPFLQTQTASKLQNSNCRLQTGSHGLFSVMQLKIARKTDLEIKIAKNTQPSLRKATHNKHFSKTNGNAKIPIEKCSFFYRKVPQLLENFYTPFVLTSEEICPTLIKTYEAPRSMISSYST